MEGRAEQSAGSMESREAGQHERWLPVACCSYESSGMGAALPLSLTGLQAERGAASLARDLWLQRNRATGQQGNSLGVLCLSSFVGDGRKRGGATEPEHVFKLAASGMAVQCPLQLDCNPSHLA